MIEPRTWGVYARRSYELAQRRGHPVYDRQAFEDAVATDGMRRLYELAEHWMTTFHLTPERLAECLVDGSVSRCVERRDG